MRWFLWKCSSNTFAETFFSEYQCCGFCGQPLKLSQRKYLPWHYLRSFQGGRWGRTPRPCYGLTISKKNPPSSSDIIFFLSCGTPQSSSPGLKCANKTTTKSCFFPTKGERVEKSSKVGRQKNLLSISENLCKQFPTNSPERGKLNWEREREMG